MPVKQISMDGSETTIIATGREFEQTIEQYLINTLGFTLMNTGKDSGVDALEEYLKSIETPTQCMRYLYDREWKKLFGMVDFFAPYRDEKKHAQRLIIKHLPYIKIDRSRGHTEIFIIMRDAKKTMRVECKFQRDSGTTEDKLYRTIIDLRVCGTHEAAIVIGGDGFKHSTINGIKEYTAQNNSAIDSCFITESKIYVLRENEFYNFMSEIAVDTGRVHTGSDLLSPSLEVAGG